MTHISENTPAPKIVWRNPNAPRPAQPSFRPTLVSSNTHAPGTGARRLADKLESEFVRLTGDGSISRGASVKLDCVLMQGKMDEASQLLRGRGFYTIEARQEAAQLPGGMPSVSVWLERR